MTIAPVFLYDGDCGFCSACARFIMRGLERAGRADRAGRPGVVPWQRADLAALGVTAAECGDAVQWVGPTRAGDRVVLAGPAAIAEVLLAGGPLWRLAGRVLRTRPATAAAWPVYRWIARHRDRMPGGSPTCTLDRV